MIDVGTGSAGVDNQYLYIIHQEGFVKIGVSKNPLSRMDALQTGSPEKLKLVTYIDANPWALEMEQFAHTILRPYRAQGEWFHTTPEVNAFVELIRLLKYDAGCEHGWKDVPDWLLLYKKRCGFENKHLQLVT